MHLSVLVLRETLLSGPADLELMILFPLLPTAGIAAVYTSMLNKNSHCVSGPTLATTVPGLTFHLKKGKGKHRKGRHVESVELSSTRCKNSHMVSLGHKRNLKCMCPCVSMSTVYRESRGTQILVEELAPSVLPPELELLGIDQVM